MADARTRERIGHLYDYLSALAQEVYAKPVRHVGDQDIAVSPGKIPDHPSVRLGGAAGDAWLRVRKTPKPVPPGFPGDVSHLLSDVVRSDPCAPPQLPPDLVDRVGEPTEDDPDPVGRVKAVFGRWVDGVWMPWAETACAALAARELYESLFRLRQRMRSDEATHELVWGHGILGWRFGGDRICHPMLPGP
ncbi:MAG: putative helicase [Streptosporangiaceae bacterium]|nr:putative helicase [Streptosporangiaceae bacterium]